MLSHKTMTDDHEPIPDDAVAWEYFKDTVNSYIRDGHNRRTAIAKAAEDGIELIEEREGGDA